jgi:ABC-type phosphate transport system substrate-binding protein
VREAFYGFLGRKSSRVKSIWVKNLLMGDGNPPEPVESEEELVAKVAKTPGAIGYVRRELADDSVKVLALISNSNGAK